MSDSQHSNSIKSDFRALPAERLLAGGVFCVIVAGFALFWACREGYIDLSFVFGQCGFKSATGLPCPGCGWTHAAQAFAAGKIIEAFIIQPAAAIFCCLAVVVAVFALLTALFGIQFRLFHSLLNRGNLKRLLLVAGLVVLIGWLITLMQALSKTGRF